MIPEPPIGATIHENGTQHTWTRNANGLWTCVCYGHSGLKWTWTDILAEVEGAECTVTLCSIDPLVEAMLLRKEEQ